MASDLIPAAVITYAGGFSSNQPILFTTQHGCEGEYSKDNKVKLEWTIQGLEAILQRDWFTSQARVTLVSSNPMEDKLPTLPNISAFRGGNNPYLTNEDEIRIYIGEVPSSTTKIDASLLDEYPYTFTDIYGVVHKADPSKPLKPVFWGFIDKIEHVGSMVAGSRYILIARDRTRLFSDNRIMSIPSLQGSTDEGGSGLAKGDRAKILLDLANAVSGKSSNDPAVVWKEFLPGLCYRGVTKIGDTFQRQTPIENPTAWLNTATMSIMDEKARPRFHRWVERPPLVKGSESAILSIEDNTPLEIIDFLSKHEELPMDFYASHINGDVIFGPRIADYTGLDSPERNYRTYFYKTHPKGTSTPSPSQQILEIRVTSSTVGTYNNFIIVDETTSGNSSSFLQNVKTAVYVLPWSLQNRKAPDGTLINPPLRTHIVYDGALDTYENVQFGATMVGLSAARVMSRDVAGITMTVLGDNTWCPGEAFRVYNTGLHDNDSFVINDPQAANNEVNKFRNQALSEASTKIGEKTGNTYITNTKNSYPSTAIDKVMNCSPGYVKTNDDNDLLVLPIYKVRSISHKITTTGNKRGWTTEVVGVSSL